MISDHRLGSAVALKTERAYQYSTALPRSIRAGESQQTQLLHVVTRLWASSLGPLSRTSMLGPGLGVCTPVVTLCTRHIGQGDHSIFAGQRPFEDHVDTVYL